MSRDAKRAHVPLGVYSIILLGTGNCTGGHVPLCKPRLSWDHGVGAYGVHERELLVHFFYFMVSKGDKCYFCIVG